MMFGQVVLLPRLRMFSSTCSRKSSYMKISDLANSFFQWPAISFPYVEFPSALSQQTFVLGVSSSQRRSYGLMRIPFKKADLAVRLVFRYLLNCGREVVDSSVDDLACLRRHTDETPARFSQSSPKLRGKPL